MQWILIRLCLYYSHWLLNHCNNIIIIRYMQIWNSLINKHLFVIVEEIVISVVGNVSCTHFTINIIVVVIPNITPPSLAPTHIHSTHLPCLLPPSPFPSLTPSPPWPSLPSLPPYLHPSLHPSVPRISPPSIPPFLPSLPPFSLPPHYPSVHEQYNWGKFQSMVTHV